MTYEINHVLLTADTIGGVWTYCMELAQGLARLGIRSTVATMGPQPDAAQKAMAEAIPGLNLFVSDYLLESMEDPWQQVDEAGAWLLSIADRVKPDIVHLNGFCHGALSWKVPTIAFIHSERISWWQAVKGESAPAHLEEYRRRVGQGLRAASMVVAPTETTLREVERIYGPFEHSLVVPNGRDGGEFVVGSKKNLILSMGRIWDEAKNLRLLEQCAPLVEWPIYVAGHTDGQRPMIPNLVTLGYVHQSSVTAWLSRASIYAFPAKYEPFSYSVLEAAYCGCALVLGDIPPLRETWGEAAIYLNPDDAQLWADCLNMLSQDPELRQELGKLAKERASTYTARNMVCQTLFAYQDLRQSMVMDPIAARGAEML